MLRNIIKYQTIVCTFYFKDGEHLTPVPSSGTNYICQQHHTSQTFSVLPLCSVPGNNPLCTTHFCRYSLYAVQAPATTGYMHTERQLQKNTTLYYHGNYFEL